MNPVMRFLRSEWLAIRTQIGLGALFVAAALPKIVDPPAFAHNIWAYRMVPEWGINVQALFMPGVEIVAGLALIVGVYRRPAAWACLALLAIFVAALSWNAFVTHNPVNCSCFDL